MARFSSEPGPPRYRELLREYADEAVELGSTNSPISSRNNGTGLHEPRFERLFHLVC